MTDGIHQFVQSCPLFDGHEHLEAMPVLASQEQTYASLAGYATADLYVALGPTPPGREPPPPLTPPDDPHLFFTLWRKARNTAYCRAVERACRDILGLDYTEENASAITRKLSDMVKSDPEALYRDVLRNRAGIRWAIKDSINTPDGVAEGNYPPDLIRVNYRDEDLLEVRRRATILERERRWNYSIHSLDDLVEGMRRSMSSCFATGWVTAVKIGQAYRRKLDFSHPSKAEAERAFNRLMTAGSGRPAGSLSEPQLSDAQLRPLHDYLVHQFIRHATDEDKVVQVHTGYLAGIYNDLRNINPLELAPLLTTYRTTRFELFHAGWPYHDILGAMGKHYPNAWLSLCWAWAMNPATMEQALDAWLDGVPYNKIIGFGGDTRHPVCAYGYAMQAREGIARVLAGRVQRGAMDEEFAREVARAILLTNGCELHRLPVE